MGKIKVITGKGGQRAAGGSYTQPYHYTTDHHAFDDMEGLFNLLGSISLVMPPNATDEERQRIKAESPYIVTGALKSGGSTEKNLRAPAGVDKATAENDPNFAHRRRKENFQPSCLLAFDLDKCSPSLFKRLTTMTLKKFSAIAYATHSNTAEKPRLRFIVETDRQLAPGEKLDACLRFEFQLMSSVSASYDAAASKAVGMGVWIYKGKAIHFDRSVYRDVQVLYTGPANQLRQLYKGAPVVVNELPELPNGIEITAERQAAPRQEFSEEERATIARDEIAAWIIQSEHFLFQKSNGTICFKTPWGDEQYSKPQTPDDDSVCYFPAGTGGHFNGHFKSLHATDAELNAQGKAAWLDALGYPHPEFESYAENVRGIDSPDTAKRAASAVSARDVPASQTEAPAPAAAADVPAPNFARDRNGRIEAELGNVTRAVMAADWLGKKIAFDNFTGELMIGGKSRWRPFKDTDYTILRLALEKRGFKPVAKDMVRDVVELVARKKEIDTAQEWLNGLKWDGIPRVADFLAKYFNVEPGEYARACSLYIWSGLAGRILKPGLKADMMPVFVGEQGCGKSSGVEAIAPDRKYFAELSFKDKDDDTARKIRGVAVAEFAEMNGLKTKAVEAIKAQVSRAFDKWVAKYKEHAEEYPRRCLFFGTSNDREILADATGARRWLPMMVGKVDVSGILQDRDQLWAEGAEIFKSLGLQYSEAERLARNVHDDFSVTDPLEDFVADWLATPWELNGTKPEDRPVTTAEVIEMLKGRGIGVDHKNKGDQMRIADILTRLGFVRALKRIDGRPKKVFIK